MLMMEMGSVTRLIKHAGPKKKTPQLDVHTQKRKTLILPHLYPHPPPTKSRPVMSACEARPGPISTLSLWATAPSRWMEPHSAAGICSHSFLFLPLCS